MNLLDIGMNLGGQCILRPFTVVMMISRIIITMKMSKIVMIHRCFFWFAEQLWRMRKCSIMGYTEESSYKEANIGESKKKTRKKRDLCSQQELMKKCLFFYMKIENRKQYFKLNALYCFLIWDFEEYICYR
ncbi:hypothetical protein HS088_TW01G00383 [Tripterygium wilfordii]|uniref:Uncharacterized protein n=1 Tax=Tripterygium wilfordii TaxID=458696 RepID=A0A7J7E1S0_TRIWF|nr:hypothetical protein HS088_TW01G00383 [Tripterygium wilfordii]